MKKAVVLLSGGLDSATTLYLAKRQGYQCFCLIFDYGQRHRKEIETARNLVKSAHCAYQILKIELPWRGSALLDKKIVIPKQANRQMPPLAAPPAVGGVAGKQANVIPNTYVPARNIIFLSFALSYAEAIGARKIFIGAHSQDYSGYPDCRPEFYRAFSQVITKGTKSGVENKKISIKTPLIHKTKAQIIQLGRCLGVPFALTWSCYEGGRVPCGECDSCYYRGKGFKEAKIEDPLLTKT